MTPHTSLPQGTSRVVVEVYPRRMGQTIKLAGLTFPGRRTPPQLAISCHVRGLDSMIGAEFRDWIFREFKVKVPFQQHPAGSLTVTKPARTLYKNIRES
ncbi:hypothetical protein K449DRAFT_429050 [Hypoxylon sp. EC38]|nr:hypothetical protein K449DRAFT_429050 [Hypoxylon sp. EC38]